MKYEKSHYTKSRKTRKIKLRTETNYENHFLKSISFHFISFHFISFHFISFHLISSFHQFIAFHPIIQLSKFIHY